MTLPLTPKPAARPLPSGGSGLCRLRLPPANDHPPEVWLTYNHTGGMVCIVGNDHLDALLYCFFDDDTLEPAYTYASRIANEHGLLLVTDFEKLTAEDWLFALTMLIEHPNRIEFTIADYGSVKERTFPLHEAERADLYAYERSSLLGLALYHAGSEA